MRATETAKQRAEAIMTKTRKEYNEIQDSISEYTIKAKTATAEMDKAGDACDLRAYNKAKSAKADAEGALEMFEARAEKLEADPLISEGEYTQMCDDVLREFNDHIEGMRAELYDITDKLVEMTRTAQAELKAANDALHTLQFDVYRGYDLQYSNSGNISGGEKKAGTRDQFAVMQWANSISKTVYDEMRQDRGGQDNANV